ncbi:DUF930 domain-containing protein [Rhizobium sp. CBN3]|uniref:DUF930 domain-containing protein n=1 Tax=Rhizobium sp. CBN3 TaxID=3058045 RepID=UPI0034A09E3B
MKVELVPPPEEKKPEQKKAEEKPKEEKPQKQAKAAPPPPPPPPPPPKSSPPPSRPKGTASAFEFGDKDSGSTKTKNGNASQGEIDNTLVPPPPSSPEKPLEQMAKATQTLQPTEQPAGNPVPEEVKLPEVATANIHPERNAPAVASAEEARTNFETEKPQPVQPRPPTDQVSKTALPEVKRLFSQSATDDPVARAARGNMPRGQRMNELCRTELNQQIQHVSAKYRDPELPSYPYLANATVLEVMKTGAFSKDGNWYSVRFRCEVDTDATKILSFAFEFGGLIPRSQYPKYRIRD